MKIWMDDNRPGPAGWTWVKNVEDAQLALIGGQVEELSLDFDLDMPECPTCKIKCGYDETQQCKHGCQCHANGAQPGINLIVWMANTGYWPRNKPVVHSANARYAMMMKQMIEDNFPE